MNKKTRNEYNALAELGCILCWHLGNRGTPAGKDADSNKPTYVTILGLVRAKELSEELYDSAIEPLKAYGEDATRLVQLAQFITQRGF